MDAALVLLVVRRENTGNSRTPDFCNRTRLSEAMNLIPLLKRLAVVVCMLTAQGQAAAQLDNITLGELATTSEFCLDVQAIPITGWSKTKPSPRAAHWLSIMGEAFWGMHHYCWARIGLQRAESGRMQPSARAFAIGVAISDYYYVIKNSPPDFILLPEIYYRMGEARVLLGELAPALSDFATSRKLKPDYWPPYLGEAKLLAALGKRKEAQALLKEGLSLVPDEPNLSTALAKLAATSPGAPRERKK